MLILIVISVNAFPSSSSALSITADKQSSPSSSSSLAADLSQSTLKTVDAILNRSKRGRPSKGNRVDTTSRDKLHNPYKSGSFLSVDHYWKWSLIALAITLMLF